MQINIEVNLLGIKAGLEQMPNRLFSTSFNGYPLSLSLLASLASKPMQ
ncbi:hypothetical protein DFR28_10423 [Arenicella xantha]|uniref:Uncharacterized protein n=1 Tax=Arenicella xantha TaxID=644221 RepID=A0A395JGM4_9GAMM|nr:hypothetical protein DFR28_10423 [Arenicella xantha]